MNFNKLRKAFGVMLLSGILIGGSFSPAISQESVSKDQYKKTTCVLDGSMKCKKPGDNCNTWQSCPGLKDWVGPITAIAAAIAKF